MYNFIKIKWISTVRSDDPETESKIKRHRELDPPLPTTRLGSQRVCEWDPVPIRQTGDGNVNAVPAIPFVERTLCFVIVEISRERVLGFWVR